MPAWVYMRSTRTPLARGGLCVGLRLPPRGRRVARRGDRVRGGGDRGGLPRRLAFLARVRPVLRHLGTVCAVRTVTQIGLSHQRLPLSPILLPRHLPRRRAHVGATTAQTPSPRSRVSGQGRRHRVSLPGARPLCRCAATRAAPPSPSSHTRCRALAPALFPRVQSSSLGSPCPVVPSLFPLGIPAHAISS